MIVACGRCGGDFDLSDRNIRAARSRGEQPVCHGCRHPPKPLDPARTSRYRRWWLEESGLALDELLEIAACIWP